MWTREELKTRAKQNLKRYFWAAFVVSLIFSLLSPSGGGNAGGEESGNQPGYESGLLDGLESPVELPGGVNLSGELKISPDQLAMNLTTPMGMGGGQMAVSLVKMVMAGALVFLVLVMLVIGIFITPVLEVGKNRFYMESRLKKESAGVGKLFWGFSNGYLKIIGAQFMRGLIISAIVFACMLPGSIMSILGAGTAMTNIGLFVLFGGAAAGLFITIPLEYGFMMVPYILTENPGMKVMETLRLSRKMMQGHKVNTFILSLSFLGWELLGLLACGVGVFFVQPYIDATFAELYAVLRKPFADRLSGFGMPEVVESDGFGGAYVNPESVRDVDGSDGQSNGYGQGGNYGQGSGYGQDGQWQSMGGTESAGASEEPVRNDEVRRSEGGPGRGYYLNGVFYPYTDEDGAGENQP